MAMTLRMGIPSLSCLVLTLASWGASTAVASDYSTTCDPRCQALADLGSSWEKDQHASPDMEFYSVPSNFTSDLAPGSLLRVEYATDLSNFTVPSGLSMSRIIYTTTDLNGTILPASAYIVWPYEPLTRGGCGSQKEDFPMVAWAHGTSGVLGNCAPSNYRNLQYHFMAPFLLALQGIAVVAPDYAGLGISSLPSGRPIPHPWVTGHAQASDLANAVTAARVAFPDSLTLTGPFVAMGHSQGGSAVWAFAERLVDQPIQGYKGAIAIAPPTRTIDVLEQALANTSLPFAPVILSAQPKLITAVTALFPSYNNSAMTQLAYDRWHNVLQPLQACLPTDSLIFSDVSLDQLAQPGWTKHDAVKKYASLAESGRKMFVGPLLVIAGGADITVPLSSVESAVDDTCDMMAEEGLEESLEMLTYADMNHFPVIQASQLKWLAWVKDRLGGKSVSKSGCTKGMVNGYRTQFTPQSVAPNFLLGWADSQEAWKYSL